MSRRHFDITENAELRAKIDEAKRRLPLPQLMEKEGLGDHAKKRAHCPFHDDEHESFSVHTGADGFWHYKCFAGCGDGDEIMFLRKLKGLSSSKVMNLYLSMANFPSHASRKSPECPQSPRSPETRKCHESPKSPVFPVYPMSNGQTLQQALKASAARNACKEGGSEKKALWQLARDLRAVEKQMGRKLSNSDWVLALRDGIGFLCHFLIADGPSTTTWQRSLRSPQRFASRQAKVTPLTKRLRPLQNFRFLNCRPYQEYRTRWRACAELRRCIASCRVSAGVRNTF
jgi:CHC2 zinc finger